MYGEIGATWTLPCEALVNTVYLAPLDLIQERIKEPLMREWFNTENVAIWNGYFSSVRISNHMGGKTHKER